MWDGLASQTSPHHTQTYNVTPTSHSEAVNIPSPPVSTGDGSVVQPPMEELGDAEGLLGGWDAEGDTEQGG